VIGHELRPGLRKGGFNAGSDEHLEVLEPDVERLDALAGQHRPHRSMVRSPSADESAPAPPARPAHQRGAFRFSVSCWVSSSNASTPPSTARWPGARRRRARRRRSRCGVTVIERAVPVPSPRRRSPHQRPRGRLRTPASAISWARSPRPYSAAKARRARTEGVGADQVGAGVPVGAVDPATTSGA